jgi:ABC-type multidrug transport system ATPase subunit/CRP-like cAMP-binding protein
MQGRIVPPQTPDATALSDQDEQQRRIGFLGRVGLFYGADQELLRQVANVLQPVPVAAGAIVCSEGDPADQFYLIGEGTLTVLIDSGGNQRELATLGPGEFFGEAALLSGGTRTATVRADTQALLWGLTAHNFQAMLAYSPEIATVVRRADQIRSTERKAAVFEVERRNLAALAQGKQRITIGRGAENDLVFQSRLVSRNHAVVEWSGDSYSIRDLGSSNGTFINGAPTRGATLRDGDEIWVADERFYFDRREIRRLVEPRGIRIDVADLVKEVKGGKRLLQSITLSILPGEFVAIVGGSGAGKTTLMDAMSGVRPATAGSVRYNGRDYYREIELYRNVLGYVPQDDIIHTDLPVRTTLRYAARLRLPTDTPATEIDAAVDEALQVLGLTPHADTRVGALSGGQRKRASIGVELLTKPRAFFLDEPTSGLDPATDAQMMRQLRRLADLGSTIILTTHATKNVKLCDKIIFLARGGYLAFIGTPQQALQYFQAEAFDEIYERLAEEATPEEWGSRFRGSPAYAQMLAEQPRPEESTTPAAERPALAGGHAGGPLRQVRQFGVLTARAFEILLRNPPILVPLLMQPIVMSVLFMMLFNSGTFNLDTTSPGVPAVILFFMAFSAFFLGVSYGGPEICKELPIFYRERMVNLGIIPYVLSKLVLLTPVLILGQLIIILALRVTGRLPSSGWDVYLPMTLTLVLTTLSGLALGLVVSAAVAGPDQANQVGPLLILPQVLFSGAIVAVPSMSPTGEFVSHLVLGRWAWEALGNIVDLNNLLTNNTTPEGQAIGRSLLLQYGDTFSHEPGRNWLILCAFVLVFFVAACLLMFRRGRSS